MPVTLSSNYKEVFNKETVEKIEGLTEGEEEVIKGNERLRHGKKISSLNNPATGNDQ